MTTIDIILIVAVSLLVGFGIGKIVMSFLTHGKNKEQKGGSDGKSE